MCCPHPCHGAGGACAAGGARQGRPPRGATPDAEAHRQGLPWRQPRYGRRTASTSTSSSPDFLDPLITTVSVLCVKYRYNLVNQRHNPLTCIWTRSCSVPPQGLQIHACSFTPNLSSYVSCGCCQIRKRIISKAYQEPAMWFLGHRSRFLMSCSSWICVFLFISFVFVGLHALQYAFLADPFSLLSLFC